MAMANFSKIPMLSKEEYIHWKIRMRAHLAAQHEDMWYVITNGPMKIMKIDPSSASVDGVLKMIEKPRHEWTTEDKKKDILDIMAMDILYKTLDKNMFSKIQTCANAKEI